MNETAGRKGRRPTLVDVAQRANVSRATASLVLRKSPLVGAETRAAVEAAMADLGYVYNLGAARMRAARSRTIGVIIPNLSNPFFGVLLAGIDQEMDGAGLATFIAHAAESPSKQDGFVTRMREHGVDGLIICPASGTGQGVIAAIEEWGIPLVQVLRHVRGADTDYAGMDQSGGMGQAIARLHALGHRNIGFITDNLHHSAHEDRLNAFRAGMRDLGLAGSGIIEIETTPQNAIALGRELTQTRPEVTAWVCHNDVIGLGLHRGFCDAGRMPGRDISIIGFDDVDATELVHPGLASVATEPLAIGALAARMLLARIETPGEPTRHELVPTHFVERGSIGPVASERLLP